MWKRRFLRLGSGCVLLLLVVPALGAGWDAERNRLRERAGRVEIIRDGFGVPHVYGKTDSDAVFGLMYAQAEDDFPRIERNYIWAMGRLAEVLGREALASDLRAHMFTSPEQARAQLEAAPVWLQDLCRAFADGLNHYLMTHPEVKPVLIERFEPWMPFTFFEGSIGGDIESIPLAGIRAFYEGDEPPLPLPQEPLLKEPSGSNGIALAGGRTRSGHPLLLINPHTSFYFRGEVHVVSEEGLDAYGAVTWGQFFVYQGFNACNGWMHTSTYADCKDEYREKVFRRQGRWWYRYGTEERPLTAREVTLSWKEGDGLEKKRFTLYHTHHGPVTRCEDGHWVTSRLLWDPVPALTQSYQRTKTRNLASFKKVLDLRTNSSNNTVYADREGHIAYFHGNFMPRRDPRFDYGKPVDGHVPQTDWQGVHPLAECISVLDPATGWIQNCNSTPFTCAGEASPKREDYPTYMAPDEETFRGLHAARLLARCGDMDLDSLIRLAYDTALPAFECSLPGLVSAWDHHAGDYPDLAAAIKCLRDWDYRVNSGSVAMTLAHFFGARGLAHSDVPVQASFCDRVRFLGASLPEKERLELLRRVLNELKGDFGRWEMPWGEVNRFQRLSGAIDADFDDQKPSVPIGMASGRWGALASFGARLGEHTHRLYGTSGNSFVAVVSFGPRVKARSLLAGGQSGDPRSPHFTDQVALYASGRFKEGAYYREDVERVAVCRYHPGEDPVRRVLKRL